MLQPLSGVFCDIYSNAGSCSSSAQQFSRQLMQFGTKLWLGKLMCTIKCIDRESDKNAEIWSLWGWKKFLVAISIILGSVWIESSSDCVQLVYPKSFSDRQCGSISMNNLNSKDEHVPRAMVVGSEVFIHFSTWGTFKVALVHSIDVLPSSSLKASGRFSNILGPACTFGTHDDVKNILILANDVLSNLVCSPGGTSFKLGHILWVTAVDTSIAFFPTLGHSPLLISSAASVI